jgi:hypothetical protein
MKTVATVPSIVVAGVVLAGCGSSGKGTALPLTTIAGVGRSGERPGGVEAAGGAGDDGTRSRGRIHGLLP